MQLTKKKEKSDMYIIISFCRSVISSGSLSHNQSLGVFTVVGTGGKAHAVRIFPNESCTCPSTTRCYHILAARMSVGLEDNCSKKII